MPTVSLSPPILLKPMVWPLPDSVPSVAVARGGVFVAVQQRHHEVGRVVAGA